MSTIDLLASQAPFLGDYTEVILTKWQASRHPDNVREIVQTARTEAQGSSTIDKAVYKGTLVLTALQQTPLNEVLVGLGAGTVMENTGNVPLTVATTAAITGAAELGSGLGVAYSLSKIPKAMDMVNKRYFKDKAESADAEEKKLGEIARIYAVGSIALTSGVTFFEDARERGRGLWRNLRTAAIAAPLVTANYAFITLLTMGGAKGAEEWLGVDGAAEWVAEKVSNPTVIGAIVGGSMLGAGWRQQRRALRGLEAQEKEVSSVDNNEAALEAPQTIAEVAEEKCDTDLLGQAILYLHGAIASTNTAPNGGVA